MTLQPYIEPAETEEIPGDLSVEDFLQAFLVGLTGLPGQMVRAKFQTEVPKEPPSILVNWLAFNIKDGVPDANAYVWTDPLDTLGTTVNSQRHEVLDVGVSIYGPLALDIYATIRDGLQIPQNLQALTAANMGLVEIFPSRKLPEPVNERFYNRVETTIILRREVIRTYRVPSLLSARGTIRAQAGTDPDYSLDWNSENVEN